jgi:uncharacterized protein (DUF302 family)
LCQLARVSLLKNRMRLSSTILTVLVRPPYIFLSFFFCFIVGLSGCSRNEIGLAELNSNKSTQQILEDAEFAISERNFRINNRLHIGRAIRERGESGFPDYEVILFCNLSHAKRMLELAPDFITYCPQRLIIRDTGTHRVISAALLPNNTSNKALNAITAEINDLMRDIVEFAAADWPELD